MFYKTEKEKTFCYKANIACDDHNFILGVTVAPGNVHDSQLFIDTYSQVKDIFEEKIKIVAIDSGYATPHICKTILRDGYKPSIAYKRPMTKKNFFKKYDYVYDEYYDCYICPNDQLLDYSTTNRDGYQEYKSNASICKACPLLKQCTHSKHTQKVITRHVWQDYLEEANHLRHDYTVKGAYARRKETVERVFADGKEQHGMRHTMLRGIDRVRDELMLKFACMNIKKLAKKRWTNPLVFSINRLIIRCFTYFIKKTTILINWNSGLSTF